MAFSASLKAPEALQGSPSFSGREKFLSRRPFPSNFSFSRRPPFRLTFSIVFARRRNLSSPSAVSSSSKKKKRNLSRKEAGDKDEDEDDVDGDALEALFSQLEEDLKNDGLSLDDDDGEEDEFSEEDLSRLERELGLALGIEDDDDQEEEEEVEEEDRRDDDEVAEMPVKLKNWQLRRLASALKTGRRKTSIKNLAAELCLDRAIVLDLLRDPPPNLLVLSAALPDPPKQSVPKAEPVETAHEEPTGNTAEDTEVVKVPVHVMQQSWTAQKRLKKAQVETLERVYRRTKRPTNAMISSIVHVTNLPRKKIVKWFEDKRDEDGVPNHRLPYARSVPKSV